MNGFVQNGLPQNEFAYNGLGVTRVSPLNGKYTFLGKREFNCHMPGIPRKYFT
jgi:hypothetical protein